VLGFSELLLEGLEGPLSELQVEDITAIRQSATNLLNLISIVVDLSRLEAGQLILAFKPVDLKQLAAKVSAVGAEPAQVEVVVELPGWNRCFCI
jgi:signal transduction histidine kinase